jgi:cytochrome P450
MSTPAAPIFGNPTYRHHLEGPAARHTTLRRALNKGFTPAVVAGLRPRVEAMAGHLLDPMEGRGTADIVHDLAYPLPVRAISDLLGVTESLHDRVCWVFCSISWSASPDLIRAAMEEVLRYENPMQMFGRAVTDDIDLDGVPVPKGSTLLLVIAAAHRDEEQFTDPDRFDIHRAHNRHFAFGGDAHVCLGSTLARLEGHIALRELNRRFPRLQADGPGAQWSSLVSFRGLRELRVTFS